MNNCKCSGSFDLIHPHELDIKDTTDAMNPASYSGLQIEHKNQGKLHTQSCDKCGDFDFTILLSIIFHI